MLTGTVTHKLEARVGLAIIRPGAPDYPLEAVVDTGFNGFLTLPAGVIRETNLPFNGFTSAQLADGSIVTLRRFHATIRWDRGGRDVLVLESEGGALVGMSLMEGHRLAMLVVPGGEVVISEV